MIHRPFIAAGDDEARHALPMYRDVASPPLHARKFSALLEGACAALFWVGLPILFVFVGLAEIRARILRAHAPRPLGPTETDALFARLCRELPTRHVSYVEGYNCSSGFEEWACLVVITFANGDVVSFDAYQTDSLARHAYQAAQSGRAPIVEYIISRSFWMIAVLAVPVTLIESVFLLLISKPLALTLTGTVFVVLAVLTAMHIAYVRHR